MKSTMDDQKCAVIVILYYLTIDYFRDEISLEDGLLFKGHRLIIPESLRGKALQIIHEGHYGVEKSL